MRLIFVVPWVAALLLWPAVTTAGIVRVEKDGTGDFVTIQGGLAAAAPGDTVLIGPGRYDTFTRRTFTTGGTVTVIGYTQTPDLTILGVDLAQTIVGPAIPTTQVDGFSTVGLGIDNGSFRTRVQGLTIENMQGGAIINAEDVEWSETHVRVMGSRGLQVIGADRLTVRQSAFSDMPNLGIDVSESQISRDVLVSHCVFTDIEFIGLVIGGAIDAEVEHCEFTGNGVGLQFEIFGQGRASHCTFRDSFRHVFAGTEARVHLDSNHFEPGAFNSVVANSAIITGSNNYLGAGISWTARIDAGFMSLTDGTIERGGDGSLLASANLRWGPEFEVLDFRNNAWGTASRDSISAWIWDGEDIPEWPVVLFEPFVGDPVPTEESSFGSFKSRFRN